MMLAQMDPATQYVVATGIFAFLMALVAIGQTVLMYYLGVLKERRQDEKALLAERRADDRAHTVASEVKDVKKALAENPPLTVQDVKPIAIAINGMKDELVREVRRSAMAEGKAEGKAESGLG